MQKFKLLLWGVVAAMLLIVSWFPHGFLPLIFIAWVPLLWMEREASQHSFSKKWVFFCTYACFLIWNIGVTWWVWNASAGGALAAMLANSLLMTFVFLTYRIAKRHWTFSTPTFLIIPLWLGFEYLHHQWQLTWPWLTLGNIFADATQWVQWYEFTGTSGGSLWILLVNVLIFELLISWKLAALKKKILKSIGIIMTIFLPIIYSPMVNLDFRTNIHELPQYPVVVVQPNIDPYNEKFNGNYDEHLKDVFEQVIPVLDSTVEYLVLPETFLTENLRTHQLEESYSVQTLRKLNRNFPRLKIIVGATLVHFFRPNEKLSATARKVKNVEEYYDVFNAALQLDTTNRIQVYYKSKLVPGVERMPYPAIFGFLEKLAINLGGTSGSQGTQEYREVFYAPNLGNAIAPVICYESIFGEYVGDYVRNGAGALFIITNDGWWDDTPGHKQHLKYGALRAIENRMWIARSANTGISCFVSPTGEIQQPQGWWQKGVIKQNITFNKGLTFYAKHGDVISHTAAIIALLILVLTVVFKIKK